MSDSEPITLDVQDVISSQSVPSVHGAKPENPVEPASTTEILQAREESDA